MRPLVILVFSALLATGTACKGEPVAVQHDVVTQRHVSIGASVVLAPGEEAVVEGTSLRIKFIRVAEDSRCPLSVTCVWEGRAVVSLQIDDGTAVETVALESRAGVRHEVGVSGYVLEIENLQPYPETEEPIAATEYRLTLKVTPAGSAGASEPPPSLP